MIPRNLFRSTRGLLLLAAIPGFLGISVLLISRALAKEELPVAFLMLQIGFVCILTFVLLATTRHARKQSQDVTARNAATPCDDSCAAILDDLKDHMAFEELAPAQDLLLLDSSGGATLAKRGGPLFGVLPRAKDIRVLLANPSATERAAGVANPSFREELDKSMRCLESLRRAGKRVSLKFCDYLPSCKLAIVGERVWVQDLRTIDAGHDEYIVALQPTVMEEETKSLKARLIDLWKDCRHPEYDFDTGDLIYRDQSGAETDRVPLARNAWWRRNARRAVRAQSEPVSMFAPTRPGLALSLRPRKNHTSQSIA